MTNANAPIRNISDTALWAAYYRAQEADRADALFSDPFARRLAGPRGESAAESIPNSSRHAWAWVTRTWLFDFFVTQHVRQGGDAVLNLAAGLDARPYRMDLPATLQWTEVDLPDLLAYKEGVLAAERPRCNLERVPLDLSNAAARRELLARVGSAAKNTLVITEGLLIYLAREQVADLARDLAAPPGLRRWVMELCSPGLLRMLQKHIGGPLDQAGAPLKFGPPEGPAFFAPHGWHVAETRTMLKTAARLKRLPFWLRLLAFLPASAGRQGSRPWSGVCVFERGEAHARPDSH